MRGALATVARDVRPLATAQRLIVDTDIGGDCDDMSAIGYAIAEHKAGRAALLGIVVSQIGASCAGSAEAMLAANGLAGYIPVYANQAATGFAAQTTSIAMRAKFGYAAKARAAYPEAVYGYRTMLANAPNGSVKIAVIGGQTSLAGLLQSPADAISGMTGLQLVTAKVSGIAIMGGNYPSTASEVNIAEDPTAAAYVAANCPVPIIGVGSGYSLNCGPGLFSNVDVDPVRLGFNTFSGSAVQLRRGWDHVAVLFALEPSYASILGGGNGTQTISGNGNSWSASPPGIYSYAQVTSARAAAARINGSLIAAEIGRYTQGSKPGFLFDFAESSGLTTVDPTDATMRGFLGGDRFVANSRVPTRAAGPSGGYVYQFDGTDDLIAVPQSGTWEGSRDIIGGIVVNLNSVTGTQTFMANVSVASAGTGFQFRVTGTDLEFYNFSAAGFGATKKGVGAAATGEWAMFSFRLRTTSGSVFVDLYKNGSILTATTAFNANAVMDIEAVPDNPMQLGAARNTTTGSALNQLFLNASVAAVGFQKYSGDGSADLAALHTSLRSIAAAKGITV